jgi:hypothetical protein
MERGYVKLWKKSLDSGMLQNPELWAFWSWCLLKATRRTYKQMVGYQEIELQPGQLVFGREAVAKELKSSAQTIRTCVKTLVKQKNITIKSTNKFSIISIVNWNTYQSTDCESNQQTNQEVTSNQPASNHKRELKSLRVKREEPKILSSKSDLDSPLSTSSDDEAHAPDESFYLTAKGKKLSGKRLEAFKRFWDSFGYKSGRAEAAEVWYALPILTNALVNQICEAAERECQRRPALKAQGLTPKMAQGWLSARRWEDESIEVDPEKARKIEAARTCLEIDGEKACREYCLQLGVSFEEVNCGMA